MKLGICCSADGTYRFASEVRPLALLEAGLLIEMMLDEQPSLNSHVQITIQISRFLSNFTKQHPESEDYYFDERGLMVMTEVYHKKRGYCCGNACKHCPYEHSNVSEQKLAALRLMGKLPKND